jgi:hypothetical protein
MPNIVSGSGNLEIVKSARIELDDGRRGALISFSSSAGL